jgi:plastocyanin
LPAPIRLSAVAGVLLAVIATSLAAAPPARAATHAVQVNDGFFAPANLTIAVGDTVTWTNADDSPHTVTASDAAFDSGTFDAGATFSHTFTTPGTYSYVCSFHEEMVGTITVVAASAPAGAGTTAAAPSTAPATDAAHAAGQDHGSAPNTAIAGTGTPNGWIPPLLIGLGLVILGLGLWPVPVVVPARQHPSTGEWR